MTEKNNDDVFFDIVNKNNRSYRIARSAAINANKDSFTSVSSSTTSPTQKKFTSNGKISNKKPNPGKAIIYFLAAGLAIGAIKYLPNWYKEYTKPTIEESHKIIEYIGQNSSALEQLGITQEDNNSLQLLSADYESLSAKYAKDSSSVSQTEIKQLLQECYSIGRNVLFSKVYEATNQFYAENPDKTNPLPDPYDIFDSSAKRANYGYFYRKSKAQ